MKADEIKKQISTVRHSLQLNKSALETLERTRHKAENVYKLLEKERVLDPGNRKIQSRREKALLEKVTAAESVDAKKAEMEAQQAAIADLEQDLAAAVMVESEADLAALAKRAQDALETAENALAPAFSAFLAVQDTEKAYEKRSAEYREAYRKTRSAQAPAHGLPNIWRNKTFAEWLEHTAQQARCGAIQIKSINFLGR